MKNQTEHIFATESDCSEGIIWTVDEDEMLCDIKKLLNEYYLATSNADGASLNISFNNGQKFCVIVKETTKKSA